MTSSPSSLARCSADSPATRASAARLRARARPAMAMRSITAAPGRMMPAARRAAITAAAIGWPLIGAAGCLCRRLDHRRHVGHGRRAQAQGGGKLARMVRHGLRAAGVLGEGGGRDIEVAGHPGHERVRRLVEIGERRAGMAQQGELDGAAEPVGVAAALGHEVSIEPGQGEQPRERVGVGRDAQERLALLVGEQLSACHGVSSVPQRSMLIVDGRIGRRSLWTGWKAERHRAAARPGNGRLGDTRGAA